MHCIHCGTGLPREARFCGQCGAPAGSVPLSAKPSSPPPESPRAARGRAKFFLIAGAVLGLVVVTVAAIAVVTRPSPGKPTVSQAAPQLDPRSPAALPKGARSAPVVRWHQDLTSRVSHLWSIRSRLRPRPRGRSEFLRGLAGGGLGVDISRR
jgi:hypothetical protein